MFRFKLLGLALCFSSFFVGVIHPVGAAGSDIALGHRYCLTGESVGLAGYDPVAYFPEGGGGPQKGLFKLASVFDGVTYRFATQANLDRFNATPTKYLPQYGGWCSYGIAVNMRFEPDPQNFVLRDGKLYLFYRDPGQSTREVWLKDPASMIQNANTNWPKLSQ
jgi:hypothetical protein